jgi:ubiquinone/menaquinone biosynthesis C-methylase UbiE
MGYTESHKSKGRDYHDTFVAADLKPHRAMLWRLEQRALDRLLGKHLGTRKIVQLDFACGTGRILAHFQGKVDAATGVDVSPSMMEVARQVAPNAELIQADLTQQDVLGDRQFNLITAFRFFPNAEPELRHAVIRVLARHLASDGILIFNNHKNRDSLPRRAARVLGREAADSTMTHEEVEQMLREAGLRIADVVPLASLPFSDNHLLMPIPVLEFVERRISGMRALAGIAQDLIYVCVK